MYLNVMLLFCKVYSKWVLLALGCFGNQDSFFRCLRLCMVFQVGAAMQF